MQKFILLRGHQGSGKTTFAHAQIAAFQKQYPNAHIVHIENDLLMTDENGEYRFSGKAVDAAQRQGLAMMQKACERGRAHPHEHILIINSNTNQKAAACIHLLRLARKHKFTTETYRLHNFYPNQHGVREADVLAAYVRLNHNRLRDEEDVPPTKPMDAATAAYLRGGHRDYIAKKSARYPALRVLKYARSVFYENRFDDALLEMRGIILDDDDNIIVRPFKKVFNYSERTAKNSRYPLHLADDHPVEAVQKINGFLGCCTYVARAGDTGNHNHQVLYSTTGSLDSRFADLTRAHCQPYEDLFRAYPNHTFLFEITDADDVHIIKERLGETLIGLIDVATGRQYSERELNDIAAAYNKTHEKPLHRPPLLENLTFGALKEKLKTVEHEGYMVFDGESKAMLCKLKSPYYLISKFLGRSNEKNLNHKLDKKHVDEEYYPLIDHLKENREIFKAMAELEKIAYIQAYLRNNI
ncbi:RNA ligase [uncultured Cardiobacterium sp.]|uniref:RNA ligase n=1 Tax=uncultured Cardiobacterium sp. TaxID=417619 RepID=UPI00261DD5EC|nr:RNA ligase [uncultured Cardiobacterium sp.]